MSHHQGKRFRSGEKEIVMNVRAFFEKEKSLGKSIMRDLSLIEQLLLLVLVTCH